MILQCACKSVITLPQGPYHESKPYENANCLEDDQHLLDLVARVDLETLVSPEEILPARLFIQVNYVFQVVLYLADQQFRLTLPVQETKGLHMVAVRGLLLQLACDDEEGLHLGRAQFLEFNEKGYFDHSCEDEVVFSLVELLSRQITNLFQLLLLLRNLITPSQNLKRANLVLLTTSHVVIYFEHLQGMVDSFEDFSEVEVQH